MAFAKYLLCALFIFFRIELWRDYFGFELWTHPLLIFLLLFLVVLLPR